MSIFNLINVFIWILLKPYFYILRSSDASSNLTTATAGHSSFTLDTQVSTSLYRGSLTHTNAGGSIGCAINSNIANQKIVICSGIDPADTTNKTLFSVILKSAS